MKGSVFDGGYHVPFIAWWPGKIPAGTTSNALASNLDVLPTVASAIGAAIPEGHHLDGRDITALLSGGNESPHTVFYYFDDENLAAVRNQRWKLVLRDHYRANYIAFDQVSNMELFDEPYWLLFDMHDPLPERYSMARENPGIVKSLLSQWEKALKEFDLMRTRPARETIP